MKKIIITIFSFLLFIYYLIGIPNTVSGQAVLSFISNIPILGSILTGIDSFSLLSLLTSDTHDTEHVIRLLSVLGSLAITIFSMTKMAYINDIIDIISDGDENFKKYAKFIVGFLIYFAYSTLINVFFLDGILFKIINLTDKEMNNFQNTINQLETLN